MTSSIPRRHRPLIALIAASALVVAACGDDDGGGGSAEAFCSIFRDESVEFSDDDDPAEVIAALNRLRDAAPPEIRDDVNVAVDGFTEFTEVDFDNATEDDFAEIENRFTAAIEASERVERWATENCDLPALSS